MSRASQVRLVLVSCATMRNARTIARAVVKLRLAACVNIHSAPIHSIYRWKGKIETAREYLLLIKSSAPLLKDLEREVLRLHTYETPEFLVVPVAGGGAAYLKWLASCLQR